MPFPFLDASPNDETIVKVPVQAPPKTVADPATVSVSDDKVAQAAWAEVAAAANEKRAPTMVPARLLVNIKSGDYGTQPDNRMAVWVDGSRDGGATWFEVMACTSGGGTASERTSGVPSMWVDWDGVGLLLRVMTATVQACELGVGFEVMPALDVAAVVAAALNDFNDR